MGMVHRVIADRGAEVICLVLEQAAQVCDALIDHRFKVVSEDTWERDRLGSRGAFAASTPPAFVNATDLHLYTRGRGHPGPRTDQAAFLRPIRRALGYA